MVIGLVAEYNPFHNGHAWQVAYLKKKYPAASIVAVMSGSLTQRGEAALLSKWQRSELAVRGGADLVLELPAVFAVRSAQDFAWGAIALLTGLNITEALAFGTETGELAPLERAAAIIDTAAFQTRLRSQIKRGASYAAALAGLLTEKLSLPEEIWRGPNNILGIEYLRALEKTGSRLKPLALPRMGCGHNEESIVGSYVGAGAIRKALNVGRAPQELAAAIPIYTQTLLADEQQRRGFPWTENLFKPLLSKLLTMSAPDLRDIYGMKEGLENKFLAAAKNAKNLDEFLASGGSKRYPLSRIRRSLWHIMLGLTDKQTAIFDAAGPLYARVLAFNREGRSLLRLVRKRSKLPLVTKLSQYLNSRQLKLPLSELSPTRRMLAYDIRATDLRTICYAEPPERGSDFRQSPFYLEEPILSEKKIML